MAVLAVVLGIAAFMIASLVEEDTDGGRERGVAASAATEQPSTETATAEATVAPTEERNDGPGEAPTADEPSGGALDFRSYTVQQGDNVTQIAIQFGVTPEEIIELNGLDEAGTIDPGQTLLIPPE
jgi:LysM repeat protein